MPFLAVFAPAPEVGLCINPSLLQKPNPQRTERGWQADVEPTVAVEHSWVGAIELNALFVGNKHRDFCPVFTGIKNLLCFVIRWFEINFGFAKNRTLFGGQIVAVNRWRKRERRKGEEHKFIVAKAAKAPGSANGGKLNFVFEFAFQVIHLHPRGYVFGIGREDFAPGSAYARERFGLFGQQHRHFFGSRIKPHQLPVGSLGVGLNQKRIALAVDKIIAGIRDPGDHRGKSLLVAFGVDIIQGVTVFPFAPVAHGQHHKSFILRGFGGMESQRVLGIFKHQAIL